MSDEITVKNSRLRLAKVDITDFEIDAFVYYAQHDLALGSGFGTAISQRGGPKIQVELNGLAPLKTTEVAISDAGDMKASHIIHAVGPRFQEPDLESKLETTIQNCLKQADGKGIKKVAFPPMGAGFYGVPLDVSARVTLGTIQKYLANSTSIEEVVVCLMDNREYKPFQSHLATMNKG
jgi:O-acetyl-ADP-ribose deacetylase (regulator of RNase III)